MKCWMSILVALAMLLPLPVLAQEEEGTGTAKGSEVNTTGKGYSAAYVIEQSTGRVLFEENANVMLPTASMAKMMTLLIAMEEIRDGRLKLDTPVTVSAFVSHMGGSRIYLKDGQVWPLQTLLAATMVQSANDAATAVAEKIAGSEQNFAEIMNSRAKQLGLNQSHFYDPHGLPNSKDPKAIDMQSAHDLAIVGMELMKYPLMRQYAATPWMAFSNGTFTSGITNPNHLINSKKRDYYPPATGIKTGYSVPAGYCVTASAKQGDMEVIAVVMGAKKRIGPESSFGIASHLMSSAFANYNMTTVVKKGATLGQASVADGVSKTVPAVAAADARALIKRGEQAGVKIAFRGGTVAAPIGAGQAVGTIVVQQNGQTIAKIPAVAGASVAKNPWWKKFWPF